MSEITTTSNAIIEDAYKLLGMFSEDRPLSGGRITEGLKTLNFLLKHFESSTPAIAYQEVLSFQVIGGKQEYTFSTAAGADVDSRKIVELNFVNIEDSSFSYPVAVKSDVYFFRSVRQLHLTGRPTECYLQNSPETSRIVFFSIPDKNYNCNIKAKFVLEQVELSEPIDEVPASYQLFLIYALAKLLHSKFPGSLWTVDNENDYKDAKSNISSSSDLNFNITTGAFLKNGGSSTSTYGGFLGGN